MTGTEQVLAGAVISFASGMMGVFIGSRGKVDIDLCLERRTTCGILNASKLTSIADDITEIKATLKVMTKTTKKNGEL